MSFMPTLVARLNKAAAAPKSRFNRISLATVLVFACMSQNAFALGLGEIEISSVINEPLAASIPVLNSDGIEQAELIVTLGSATDYQIAGVTWDFSHSELQFDVGYAANGDLMVNVSSTRAIREPYLNLLVQARWPAGRLLREYTILLDFPVFTGEQNSTPVARASAPAPVAATPAPVAAPRPAPVVAQPNPAPRLVSVAPATDSAAAQPLGDGDYRIQNGDTLWSLGGRVAQDLGVSRHQAMLAIREANPEAFTQGNLNMLRAGSVIRVPTRNAALSRSATQAASEFAQAMSDSGQIADATPLQSRATDFRNEAGSDQSDDAQFRLTSAGQANAAVAGSGVDQIIEENQLLSDINAALEEELQAASIENRDLSGRLQNLEEQITVMEALIEVENSEIRAVQEAVTSTQPVVNTITTADVQEEGLVSKLLGILPIVGLVVIGLLAGAYLVIRRRKSGDHAGDIAGFDEEYDEDAPIYAEQPASEESVETAEPEPEPQAEPEESVDDDLENLAVDIPDDSAVEDIEMPVDTPDEEKLSTDVNDQEEAAAEPDASAPAEEEEDWASDFDDLDAFFDDVDDTAKPETEASEEATEATEEEESESEKTQIFDASMLAGANTEDSEAELEEEPEEENAEAAQEADADTDHENSVEQLMDFSLDEDDLTTEEPEKKASQDPEDDEFSLDFDLDGEDSEAEPSESEPEAKSEADEVAPEDDENMVAFDISDEDLPSESEESEQPEEIEEIEAAEPDPEPESEPEPEPEPESEDNSDSEELDISDLGLDDEESEESDDDLDALLDHFDDDTDDSEAAAADAAVDEDLDIDLDGDLDDLSALLDEVDDSSTDSEAEPSADKEPSADEEPAAEEEPSADKEPSVDEEPSADQEPSADKEPSANEEQPATADSEDTDDLLGDFGDGDLDLSEVGDEGNVAEECETKLELAAAYIEMGDNSGAKELLDEVIREGDESFQARANELIEKMG